MNSVYPRQEIASRFRAAVMPYLRGDSRMLVDEWVDDVGEYSLAVDECFAVAAKNHVTIDPVLIADARRAGFEISRQMVESV